MKSYESTNMNGKAVTALSKWFSHCTIMEVLFWLGLKMKRIL